MINANVVSRPRVRPAGPTHQPFSQIDRGTSFTLKLKGDGVRPRSLNYFIAKPQSNGYVYCAPTRPWGASIYAETNPTRSGSISRLFRRRERV